MKRSKLPPPTARCRQAHTLEQLQKNVEGRLVKAELHVPAACSEAPGITLIGKTVRSLVFSTDVALIRNCDADAVLAVYPFTCHPVITQSLLMAVGRPVLTGIAGATTAGPRSVVLAIESELQGASGVVINAAAKPSLIRDVRRCTDVPIVVTATKFDAASQKRVEAGASIVNVAAGSKTAEVVRAMRTAYPSLPIIATSGPSEDTAKAAIEAGADALSWTPPSLQELERKTMEENRRLA